MQETEKIWMNGELVDWADAKVHVGVHGLHYGSGVFEGIRCYDTAKGPAIFRLRDHLERLESSAKILFMEMPHTVDELRAATHELVADERPRVVLHPSDRVLRLWRARRGRDGEPGRRRHLELPVGRVPRRGRPEQRDHDHDLELGARRSERDPACREGDRHLPELDARDDGGPQSRVRRGDHAHGRRIHRRRAGGDDLRREETDALHAVARDVHPPRYHSRHGHPHRRGAWLQGRRDAPHPLGSLPRRRGLHGRYGGRGDACPVRSTGERSVSAR